METALLNFILYITASFIALVAQHLSQDPLQSVVAHGAEFRKVGIAYCFIAVVAYVERRAVEMARIFRGVAVMVTKLAYVVLGAQHTGPDDSMQRYALYLQTVDISPADVAQQNRRTGHKIRDATGHAVYLDIRTYTYVDKLLLALFRILPVFHRRNTVA